MRLRPRPPLPASPLPAAPTSRGRACPVQNDPQIRLSLPATRPPGSIDYEPAVNRPNTRLTM